MIYDRPPSLSTQFSLCAVFCLKGKRPCWMCACRRNMRNYGPSLPQMYLSSFQSKPGAPRSPVHVATYGTWLEKPFIFATEKEQALACLFSCRDLPSIIRRAGFASFGVYGYAHFHSQAPAAALYCNCELLAVGIPQQLLISWPHVTI